jgi:hypothetical protein
MFLTKCKFTVPINEIIAPLLYEHSTLVNILPTLHPTALFFMS